MLGAEIELVESYRVIRLKREVLARQMQDYREKISVTAFLLRLNNQFVDISVFKVSTF